MAVNMKKMFSRYILLLGTVSACGLAATDAEAAYTGFVTRSTCGADIFNNDSVGWEVDPDTEGACFLRWNPPAPSTGAAVYNLLVERSDTPTTITATLSVLGSNSRPIGRVCATLHTYDAGGFDSASTIICTAGATNTVQDITAPNIVLPAGGAANIAVTATFPGAIYKVNWTYTSNSTSSP